LCYFLGIFGAHRFYLGKIGTGVFMLLTLGGLFFWALIDLLILIFSVSQDAKGRPLAGKSTGLSVLFGILTFFGFLVGLATLFIPEY
jgi:hypothetical protein